MKKVFSIMLALVLILTSALIIVNVNANDTTPFEFLDEDDSVYLYGYNGTDTNLVIPDTLDGLPVKTIELTKFNTKIDYNSITFPKTAEKIAFNQNLNCKSFVVDPENEKYVSVDGVIFSKNMVNLVKYPNTKEDKAYVVPHTVLIIDSLAFSDNQKLEKVVFDGIVKSIGSGAFSGCINLKTVSNLPIDYNTIEVGVFDGCDNIDSTAKAVDHIRSMRISIDGVIGTYEGGAKALSLVLNAVMRWLSKK